MRSMLLYCQLIFGARGPRPLGDVAVKADEIEDVVRRPNAAADELVASSSPSAASLPWRDFIEFRERASSRIRSALALTATMGCPAL